MSMLTCVGSRCLTTRNSCLSLPPPPPDLPGKPLDEDALGRVMQGCDMAIQLDEDKRTVGIWREQAAGGAGGRDGGVVAHGERSD